MDVNLSFLAGFVDASIASGGCTYNPPNDSDDEGDNFGGVSAEGG